MEQSVAVGERGAQLHAARRGVDHAADRFDAALVGVERTVGELQSDFGHAFQRPGRRAVAARQFEQPVFGHREVDVHFGVVGDGRELDRGTDQRTDAQRKRTHHAVGRSLDHRIGEVVGGADALGLGLGELRFGGEQLVFGCREVELRDDVALEQLFLAVVGQPGRGDAGLGCGDVGIGGLERGLVGHLVDDEERPAFRDLLSLLDEQLRDGARNLRVYVDVLASADGSRVVDRNLTVAGRNGQHGVFAGTRGRRGLSAADGCQAARSDGCLCECLLHNHLS